MNIKDLAFLIRNKKKGSELEKKLVKLGVDKKDIHSYTNIYDIKDIKTDKTFLFTLDEESKLSDGFEGILQEIELKEKTVYTTILSVLNNNNESKFYNHTPLLIGSYDDLVSYLDVTTIGVFIPSSLINFEGLNKIEGVSFYTDLTFYKSILNDYDFRVIPKSFVLLKTNEFEAENYSKDDLHNEIKLIMDVNGK